MRALLCLTIVSIVIMDTVDHNYVVCMFDVVVEVLRQIIW